jgi:RNA polymerase sigma-70 factor (ECF subfamily)
MIGVMAEDRSASVTGTRLGEFSSWMTSEQKRIFLLCRRMLQDPGEADCVTQEIFVKAYKALNKRNEAIEDGEDLSRWVTRIAINSCLDRLRSNTWKFWQRRPPPADEALILQCARSQTPDAERQVFARQVQQRLEMALQKLSMRQRAVFSLRHYEELSTPEIATVLKLDEGTVKAHLFRALVKMRTELKDLYLRGARSSECPELNSKRGEP